MREIKFRVWDKWNKAMSYSEKALGLSDFFLYVERLRDGGNDVVIMQFTGIKDKNGKDIYEVDIASHAKESNYTNRCTMIGKDEIIWDEWTCKFKLGENDLFGMIYKSYEIIGNKYENPELLEKKT